MVFQDPAGSFDPRRTLGAGIMEGPRNCGVDASEARRRALDLLARCGLPKDMMDRYPPGLFKNNAKIGVFEYGIRNFEHGIPEKIQKIA